MTSVENLAPSCIKLTKNSDIVIQLWSDAGLHNIFLFVDDKSLALHTKKKLFP